MGYVGTWRIQQTLGSKVLSLVNFWITSILVGGPTGRGVRDDQNLRFFLKNHLGSNFVKP